MHNLMSCIISVSHAFHTRSKYDIALLINSGWLSEPTRIVKGSDNSSVIPLSEDKDIFIGITLFERLMLHYNLNIDLVNDNVYTKVG